MSAIWTPLPAPSQRPAGLQGSASMVAGSVVSPITWLDAQTGEPIINGTITTVWDSEPIECVSVTHTVSPSIPAGITIVDNPGIGGIIVTGSSTALLTTIINNDYVDIHGNKGNISSNNLPPDAILTHYLPLSTKYNDFVIGVTVSWKHDYKNPQVSQDQQSWILRLWNNWSQEKNDVKGIAATEVKGG